MSNIYRKSSLEKLSSPDHLDKMVSISSPGIWTLLIAGIVLIIGLAIWGIFGETVSYISINGVYIQDNEQAAIGDENYDLVCFSLMKNSAEIKSGMMAKIVPININEEENGYMIGKVIKVSPNYLTDKELISELKNDKLSEFFRQYYAGNPVVEVQIKLEKDKTESGYKWSDSRGENIILENNTLIEGSLILKKEAPAKKILSKLMK